MNDYLFERRQRSKINNSYSTWEDMLFVGRQGSILESIIFNNMFLSNLFLIFNDKEFMLLCRWQHYIQIYTIHETVDLVTTSLHNSAKELFKCFSNNQKK